jgi:hypothetical protein
MKNMKTLNKILSQLSTIFLIFIALFCAGNAVWFLAGAVFNFQPSTGYAINGWNLNKEDAFGIPVPVKMNMVLPDTSIRRVLLYGQYPDFGSVTTTKAVSRIEPAYAYSDSLNKSFPLYTKDDSILLHSPNAVRYSDTITAFFSSLPSKLNSKDPAITGAILTGGIVVVETQNRWLRLFLYLPVIIRLIACALVSWQMALLLREINKGYFFERNSFYRLKKVGWVFIISSLAQYIIYFFNHKRYYAGFKSAALHYGLPIPFDFFSLRPSNSAEFSWMIAGYILIMISGVIKRKAQLKISAADTPRERLNDDPERSNLIFFLRGHENSFFF